MPGANTHALNFDINTENLRVCARDDVRAKIVHNEYMRVWG